MKLLPIFLRTASAVCFAILLSSASCELFDKVDDLTIDIEIKHTFVVNASATDPTSYSKIDEIDPSDNADFNKYKDKIKEVTVNSVEYTVANYVGDPGITFSNGTGSFTSSGTSSTALASAAIAIENIQNAVGTEKTLAFTVEGLDAIANEMEQLKTVKFQVAGTVSQVPVAFHVPITIKMTIVADAL